MSTSNRPVRRVPGYNVDRIDVAAGLRELQECGYDEPHTAMVIEYALQRWARGEEEAVQKGAIDKSFHGISLTCWLRVLAAARVGGEAQEPTGSKRKAAKSTKRSRAGGRR